MNNIKKRNKEVIKFIEKFEPKINKSLLNTDYQDREDLRQEIQLKMTEKINEIEANNPPSFWKLINK